jgi:hypothetical protein
MLRYTYIACVVLPDFITKGNVLMPLSYYFSGHLQMIILKFATVCFACLLLFVMNFAHYGAS